MYGSSFSVGTHGLGAVFEIAPSGLLTVLYNFDRVHGARGYGLMLAANGEFYGTTSAGGPFNKGTLFRITSNGELTELHNFTGRDDGANPYAAPVQGIDGNFYGTAYNSGQGYGTVFKFSSSGKLTTLYSFDYSHGSGPNSPLVQAADGNFYGTTYVGGTDEYGTVYKVTPSGTLTVLHNFAQADGSFPNNLLLASDGNLYGTTYDGGADAYGVVFKITTAGVFTIVHTFNGTSDGACTYAGLVQATDGNFYGATLYGGVHGKGTIYRMTKKGRLSVLYNLHTTSGSDAEVTMLQHTTGLLYGDTGYGGTYRGGTFYSMDIAALKPFVSLVPATGKVGKSIGILGQGFQGTESVAFNGIPASFKVVSSTYLEAIVPGGATTGFVTVTAPKGKLTSNKKFQVL